MTDYTSQYSLEQGWSIRSTETIVMDSIKDDIPQEMELAILGKISAIHIHEQVSIKEIFSALFTLVLKEQSPKPIQAIATQLGHIAGFSDAAAAFEWGVLLIKECATAGLYNLRKKAGEMYDEWYVVPNYALDKKTIRQLGKLQYLPPMQVVPLDWHNNHHGGWLWEEKHIVLGNKFTKHNKPVAYDALNKLQRIAWTIDSETYLKERQTNHNMNKQKFLRVLNEYLGKEFYFVWRYDSRGRSYSSGYDLNIQSNEYGKALISLANKEEIADLDALYIAIANHAGQDKLTWEERIAWAKKVPVDETCKDWDEPVLGRKALRAMKDTIAGRKSGYTMNIDATASGIQIMAALSGCKQTAQLVNMTDPSKRHDLYTEVADQMNGKLTKPVVRKVIKRCTMTNYYNSKATPKKLLNEEELSAFYGVLDGLLPGAQRVMETINRCWNPTADHHTWTLPDGHTAYVPVVEPVDAIYRDDELGEVPVRYYTQCSSDNFRSLAPNIIHSIDGYIVREMVRRADFQLAHVHD